MKNKDNNNNVNWQILYIQKFFSSFFFWMMFPYMINFLIDKVGTWNASFIMSLLGVFSIITTLLIGNLADIIGNVKAITYTTIIRIVCIIMMITSLILKMYYLFGVFYVLQAIPNSISKPSFNSLVYKLTSDEKEIQNKTTNMYIASNLAVLIAPSIGALIFKQYLIYILVTSVFFEIIQLYIFTHNFKFIKFKKTITYSFVNNLSLYKRAILNKKVIFFGMIIILSAFVTIGFIDDVQNIYLLRYTNGVTIFNYHLTSELAISLLLILNAIIVISIGKVVSRLTSTLTISKIILILLILFLIFGITLLGNSLMYLIIAASFMPLAEVLMPGVKSRFVYQVSDSNTQSLYSSAMSLYTSLGVSFNSFLIVILVNHKLVGIGITYIVIAILGVFVLFILNKILVKGNT